MTRVADTYVVSEVYFAIKILRKEGLRRKKDWARICKSKQNEGQGGTLGTSIAKVLNTKNNSLSTRERSGNRIFTLQASDHTLLNGASNT